MDMDNSVVILVWWGDGRGHIRDKGQQKKWNKIKCIPAFTQQCYTVQWKDDAL